MSMFVADLEANGLLEEADTIWCGYFKQVSTGTMYKWDVSKMVGITLEDFLKVWIQQNVDTVIGHNFIDYDIPLLEKLAGLVYEGEVYDTFIMSMMLDADRKKHPDAPKKGMGHSLANFGAMFGRPKPEHEDWTRFSKDMSHRCAEDVEINYEAWLMLSKEMGL